MTPPGLRNDASTYTKQIKRLQVSIFKLNLTVMTLNCQRVGLVMHIQLVKYRHPVHEADTQLSVFIPEHRAKQEHLGARLCLCFFLSLFFLHPSLFHPIFFSSLCALSISYYTMPVILHSSQFPLHLSLSLSLNVILSASCHFIFFSSHPLSVSATPLKD